MQGCAVLVAALTLIIILAPRAATPPPDDIRPAAVPVPPAPVGDTSVAWHPISSTNPGARMYMDAPRGRILSLVPGARGYDMLVLNLSGAVQARVPSVMASNTDWVTRQGLLDPRTGYLYLLDWRINCLTPNVASADLTVVDPGNATLLHDWAYPTGLISFALHDGRIYAGHATYTTHLLPGGSYTNCQGVPDANITVINATDGSVEDTITNLPPGYINGLYMSYLPPHLAVDPSGRWLFVPLANDTSSATYRVSLADRTYSSFGIWGDAAFSPNGDRVFLCNAGALDLHSYWVENGTPSGSGSCSGWMAVNPVTGAIASDGATTVTLSGNPVSFNPALSSVAWTDDGRSLLGISDAGPSPAIGAWSGAPTANTTQSLLNPRREPFRVRFDSVGGMNRPSLRFAIDGASVQPSVTWTCAWQASVNVSALPDGRHNLSVEGVDLVDQPLQATQAFETDGSPPAIAITSANETAHTPYSLAGRISEPHPSWLTVDGRNVPLLGTGWFTLVTLRIGDNRFLVEAADVLGNYANLTANVRYWPERTDNLTNPHDHFSVFVPPGWAGQANVSLGGTTLSMLLVGPAEGSNAATFMVTTLPAADAQETQDYVMRVADQQRDLLVGLGGSILVEPRYATVDGRPAVTFEAWVYLGSDTTRYVEAVVVSAAWKRAYVLTMGISEPLWPSYAGSWDWILEGFHIDPALTVAPLPVPLWEPWQVIGLSGAITATAIAVALLAWWRRRQHPP